MPPAAGKRVLLYGCNGYTAQLLLPRLLAVGVEVIAAGRDRDAVHRTAAKAGCEPRVFDLAAPEVVDGGIRGVRAVLNAAGPFSRTTPPLIDACLRERIDYLDLSGEVEALQYAASSGAFARTLGVMVLPSVGFDVVPSDCLAMHLVRKLPTARHLTLSISPSNLLSRGSAVTFVENAGTWVQYRRDGVLESMKMRTQMRWVDFGRGRRPAIAVSWGDLVTAFHSTGIPSIEVYFEATSFRLFAVTANQLYGWAMGPATRTLLEAAARAIPGGPDEAERAEETCVIVGEVTDGERTERARLVTPEAYSFTAEIAARVVAEVLGGARHPGFVTPGALLGPDFVLGSPGVTREDLP